MKVSYNWLQSFFEKKLPEPAKLVDLLTRHSFETELVGKEGKDYLLDVDILPNRAHDCLSHLGVAKEIAALLKIPFAPVDYAKKIKEDKKNPAGELVKVQVEEPELCPRYTARAIADVKVGPSPDWLTERLMVCGLRPINNIVDIANYAMLETGQPLHAFDADKLSGVSSGASSNDAQKTLVIRKARKGEKITTLDEGQYDLDENILVIADEKEPVCIAGIKGGKNPGVETKTTRVILEAANFSPQFTRRASRQLKLKTDASWRFENDLDPAQTKPALARACQLLQEICGCEVAKGFVDVYPGKERPRLLRISKAEVEKILGMAVPTKEFERILQTFSAKVRQDKSGSYTLTILTQRRDIRLREDVSEEVMRLYGCDKIPATQPQVRLQLPQFDQGMSLNELAQNHLAKLGFTEMLNYSLINEADLKVFRAAAQNIIRVANPASELYTYLRPGLLVGLLHNANLNLKSWKNIKLFELGKVFFQEQVGSGKQQEIMPKERWQLEMLLAASENS